MYVKHADITPENFTATRHECPDLIEISTSRNLSAGRCTPERRDAVSAEATRPKEFEHAFSKLKSLSCITRFTRTSFLTAELVFELPSQSHDFF
jgi:hypothetical protein